MSKDFFQELRGFLWGRIYYTCWWISVVRTNIISHFLFYWSRCPLQGCRLSIVTKILFYRFVWNDNIKNMLHPFQQQWGIFIYAQILANLIYWKHFIDFRVLIECPFWLFCGNIATMVTLFFSLPHFSWTSQNILSVISTFQNRNLYNVHKI